MGHTVFSPPLMGKKSDNLPAIALYKDSPKNVLRMPLGFISRTSRV